MTKILIACDNDILLDKLKKHAELELINIPKNQNIITTCLEQLPDMLIIDAKSNHSRFLKKLEKKYKKNNKNIITIDTQSQIYVCFNKFDILLDLIKVLEDFNDSIKNILDDMLWNLHFNLYSKGTTYLKTAILLAYQDNSLLFDTNKLIKNTAKLYNLNEKNVRNNIDNALNLAFKLDDIKYDIDFFNGIYDGRKISLKYFISLSVHYIDKNVEPDFIQN